MMLGTNVEQDEMTCCVQKNDKCGGIGKGHSFQKTFSN